MKGVDTIAQVRREFYVQGRPIKEICRELDVLRNTVRKILRSGATAFEYERSVQPQPKIRPWREELDRLLVVNAARASRERLTLRRGAGRLMLIGFIFSIGAIAGACSVSPRRKTLQALPAGFSAASWRFDISMANHDPAAFEEAARKAGFLGLGFYPRSGFMHIDLGPARSWGGRFSVRATRFVPESLPPREKLSESRTLKGGGAAGIEIAEGVMSETRGALQPLIPYLNTLRWVFIAVALLGIAVSIYARFDDWKRGRR